MWPNYKLIGRCVKRGNQIRIIVRLYSDIVGGVILDCPIEGFRSWNLNELELMPNEQTRTHTT